MDLTVSGTDMENLLFNYLDEFLYSFSTEPNFIARKVEIILFDKVSSYACNILGTICKLLFYSVEYKYFQEYKLISINLLHTYLLCVFVTCYIT